MESPFMSDIRKVKSKQITSSEKKIHSGTCFDFLKDTSPTKKTYGYISKREELLRSSQKISALKKKQNSQMFKPSKDMFKKTIKNDKKQALTKNEEPSQNSVRNSETDQETE